MSDDGIGTYGEQGDFDQDGQLEDALAGAGILEAARKPAPEGAEEDDTAPIPGAGKLLEEPSAAKIFKAIDAPVARQERVAKNRDEKAKHHQRVRSGQAMAFLEKTEDRSVYRATIAPGVDEMAGSPVPNKMDDLCNKIVSQLLADDFLPDPKPDGDSDSDRGAADLSKQFLRADGMTSGTDDRSLLRDALNDNISAASAFAVVWVDPMAGGWRPSQVMAHPRAEDAARPLYAPMLDKATNAPIETSDGPIMEKSSSPVLRYVASVEGQGKVFTENAAEADRQWMPKHCRRLLSIAQVRCFPQSADVFSASAITLLMYDSLGEARKRFKVLRDLPDAQLKTLLEWKPRRWKTIVPESHRPKDSEGAGAVTDDHLIFWYEHYLRIGADYQDGGVVCVNGAAKGTADGDGAGFVLLRDTLRDDVEVDEGKVVPILRDPPVTQFACITDIEDKDAFGMALLARFGGSKDAWDTLWMGVFDALFKALNPNSYIPGTSTVTKEDVNRRDGTPIEILTKDDMPTWEQAPELPSYVPGIMEKIELAINSSAGTNETSNGLDSAYSESGIAKEIAIKQARVALAQYWQNTVKGLTHYWRIKTQLAQAKLTVPQLVRLTGIGSAYKQPWFIGADLTGVREVALQAGSGSMQTPAEKAQHLAFLQQNTWLDPETAGELARSSMTDDLGLPPNIHEEAVNREIAGWSKGPPPGWLEQQAQYAADMAEAQQQLMGAASELAETGGVPPEEAMAMAQQGFTESGRQMPTPPATPFEDRPHHQERTVAAWRHRAFQRMMSTVEYGKQPEPWRAPFEQRYEAARQAAGIATVAEEQQAAQQQAEAQQQQAAAGEQSKSADADADRQFKKQEADADRAADLEKTARSAMSAEAVAGARAKAGGQKSTTLPLRGRTGPRPA